MSSAFPLLRFRCTGCGNCCKEPVLPLTDQDIALVSRASGRAPRDFVAFTRKDQIALDDSPESFAIVRQGRRVLTMKQARGRCTFLGDDDRCTVYEARPMGCRVFPFDATFGKRDGKLRRLRLIQATDCLYELDGQNSVARLRATEEAYHAENDAYLARLEEWNREQRRRRRAGKAAGTTRELLEFLGA